MFTMSQAFSAAAAAMVVLVVIDMLRKGKLRERHALWWLLAGVVGLGITLFPGVLDALASFVGVTYPLNLAFFGGIIVLFLIIMQQSKELTRLEERSRTLAEQVALLDDRLRLQGDLKLEDATGSVEINQNSGPEIEEETE